MSNKLNLHIVNVFQSAELVDQFVYADKVKARAKEEELAEKFDYGEDYRDGDMWCNLTTAYQVDYTEIALKPPKINNSWDDLVKRISIEKEIRASIEAVNHFDTVSALRWFFNLLTAAYYAQKYDFHRWNRGVTTVGIVADYVAMLEDLYNNDILDDAGPGFFEVFGEEEE